MPPLPPHESDEMSSTEYPPTLSTEIDPYATVVGPQIPPTVANPDPNPAGAAEQKTLTLLGASVNGPASLSDRFGDYRLVRYIAKGGMGSVYEAVHVQLELPVALKLINSGDSATDQDIQRFLVEARAVAALHSHPSIVKIHDIGEELGQHYLVMQLIRGGSLKERLKDYFDDPRKSVQLMVKVAEAISHAHRKGLLHRDLKPDNILVDDEDGSPYVTDFGLAKRVDPADDDDSSTDPIVKAKGGASEKKKPRPKPDNSSRVLPAGFESTQTEGGTILGTPSFMPPEQAQGQVKDITTLSDVYGLGAVLFTMLCGRAPFVGGSVRHILEQVVCEPPPSPRRFNPKVDADLEAVCLKCLEKDPADRYESAQAFARDLNRWLRHEPVHARRLDAWERVVRWVKHEPMKVAAIGLGVGFVVLAIGMAVVRHWEVLEKHDRLMSQQMAKMAETGLHEARDAISKLIDEFEIELGSSPHEQDIRKKLFTRALTYFEGVIQREGDIKAANTGHRLELAKAHIRVADLAHRIGEEKRDKLDSHYESAIKILEKLQNRPITKTKATDPELEFEIRMELGNAYHEYGILRSQRGESVAALEFYEKGRKVREELCLPCPKHGQQKACGCEGNVEVRTGLGRSYGYIGDIYRAAGKDSETKDAYLRSHAIRLKLYNDYLDSENDPKRFANLTIQLERSHGNLAWLARHQGHLDVAISELEDGLTLLEELLARPELDRALRRIALEDLGDGLTQIAQFHLEAGEPQKAIDAISKSDPVFRDLLLASGGAARSQAIHASAEIKRAEAYLQLGQIEEAEASCDETRKLLDEARDVREDVIYKKTSARSRTIRGKVALFRKQLAVAEPAFATALKETDELLERDSENLEFRSNKAEILANLSKTTDNKSKAAARLESALKEQDRVTATEPTNRLFKDRLAEYQKLR